MMQFKVSQRGVAILAIAVVILLTVSVLVFFTTRAGILRVKITRGQYATQQALDAAQGGLDYGALYLKKNYSTIMTTKDIDNLVNYSVPEYTLPDKSKFQITITNPGASTTHFLISSAGTSKDGAVQRTVQQYFKVETSGTNIPDAPLYVRNNVLLKSSAVITNMDSSTVIHYSGSLDLSGNAELCSDDACKGATDPEYQAMGEQITGELADMSSDQYFEYVFGATKDEVKNNPNTNYIASSDMKVFENALDGSQGEVFWFVPTTGTLQLSSNFQAGTDENPVVIIIDGDFKFTGTPNIKGMIYQLHHTNSTQDFAGDVSMKGIIIAEDELEAGGNFTAEFDSDIRGNIIGLINDTIGGSSQTNNSVVKIPGTWKEF